MPWPHLERAVVNVDEHDIDGIHVETLVGLHVQLWLCGCPRVHEARRL